VRERREIGISEILRLVDFFLSFACQPRLASRSSRHAESIDTSFVEIGAELADFSVFPTRPFFPALWPLERVRFSNFFFERERVEIWEWDQLFRRSETYGSSVYT
jgi:hypothetical protein